MKSTLLYLYIIPVVELVFKNLLEYSIKVLGFCPQLTPQQWRRPLLWSEIRSNGGQSVFTEVSDCATLDSWGWVSGDPVPAPGPRRRGCQHTGVTTVCSRSRRNFTSCSPSLSACCNCNGLLPAEHYQIVPNVGWIGFLPRRGAPGFCKYWETLRRLEVGL